MQKAWDRIKRLLLLGWRGVEIWSVLISLGIPAMVRGIWHNTFGRWPWDDQLALFGGLFLLTLGVLAFIVQNRILAPRTQAPPRIGENKPAQDAQLPLSDEQHDALKFYANQKSNWKQHVRLKLLQATSMINAGSPYVSLKFEATNFLPADITFIRVIKSEGSVSAGVNGACDLPPLPETINEKVSSCDQKEFEIKLPVNGTKVPEFLRSCQGSSAVHQWHLKGEWFIDVYGKTQLWATKSYSLSCNQTKY